MNLFDWWLLSELTREPKKRIVPLKFLWAVFLSFVGLVLLVLLLAK